MLRWIRCTTIVLGITLLAADGAPRAQSADTPDLAMYARIRDEGTARSQVMRYAAELMGMRATAT